MHLIVSSSGKLKEVGEWMAIKNGESSIKDSILKSFKKDMENPVRFLSYLNPTIFIGAKTSEIGFDYFTSDNYKLSINKNNPSIPPNLSSISENALCISKETINKFKIKHNSPIFNGVFKNSDHYNLLVNNLPTNDSLIIITDQYTLSNIFNKKINSGIYLEHDETIIKSNTYTIDIWDQLKASIINVFSNLNAKKISIYEEDKREASASASIDKSIIKFCTKTGVSLEQSIDFKIDIELSPTLNTEKARAEISNLRRIPAIYAIAENCLTNPNSAKLIHQKIDVNLNFDANINVLTILQGSFKFGYTRKFDCKIEF